MGSPRFNRINPNRSIPTTRSRSGKAYWNHSFQSYQSKQINPDDDIVTTPTFVPGKGFNRINQDRSIPTQITLT